MWTEVVRQWTEVVDRDGSCSLNGSKRPQTEVICQIYSRMTCSGQTMTHGAHVRHLRRHKGMSRLYTQTDFAWKCVQEYHGYLGLVDRMLTGAEGNYRPSYKPRYPFLC